MPTELEATRTALKAVLRLVLQDAVDNAQAAGYVITVEQVPLQPLAQGHYRTVVNIRDSRAEYQAKESDHE